MHHINNNILATFGIMLMLISISGQYIIHDKANEIEKMQNPTISKITGKATGSVSFIIMRPLSEINFDSYLAFDNESIVLIWNNLSQDNVSIFITNNITAGFNYGSPNVTNITTFNWTDTTAKNDPQRYYRLGIWNGGIFNVSDNIEGKFDIPIYSSNQIPGDVEFNTISLPLLPNNLSMNNIFRWSANGDTIGTYNPFKMPFPGFDASMFFTGLGWWGDLTEINVTKTYWLSMVSTPYNLTIVGKVPTENITVHLVNSTQIPGEVEFNTFAWHSECMPL